jgi:elongation factor P
MATTSDIKNGMCIEHSNDIFVVKEFQHVKPGKGNAFVRTKLKSITNGKVLDHTFPAGHKVDEVKIERRQFSYLYSDGDQLNFMNIEDYEQITLPEHMLDAPQFLKEGTLVYVIFHSATERPLAAEMPQQLLLEVTYVEPGVKGDTATNTLTPATVETGATVRVPLFIKEGDIIKIDTTTGEYLERQKK